MLFYGGLHINKFTDKTQVTHAIKMHMGQC